MSDILELETRRNIYDHITKNPGVNLSAIAETLQLSAQLVDYHLSYMENHELITIDKSAGYKRCYIRGSIGVEDKRMLALLRQGIPLQIVLFLLEHPFSRYKVILQHLGVSSALFSYHLRKLVKNGLVTVAASEMESGYVCQNEKNIVSCLLRYQPSTVTKMVKDTWDDFGPPKK